MGFSYSVYCGPAIIVNGQGPDWIETEYIDERIYEARKELSSDSRYFLPNRGGYGRSMTPREDCDQEPERLQPTDISDELDRFATDFASDIEWLQGQFGEGADVQVQWVILMNAM